MDGLTRHRVRSALFGLLPPLLLLGACAAQPRVVTGTDFSDHTMSHAVNGTDLPDHAIAFFYDDGPDKHSLELAQYLHSQRVSATFNLVGAVKPQPRGTEPPAPSVDGTGYLNDPGYLANLAALDQRLANHTFNHVPIDGRDPSICTYDPDPKASIEDCIAYQVKMGEDHIAPYISNDFFLLTPPGGRWGAGSSEAVASYDRSLLRIDPGASYIIGYSSFTVEIPTRACGMQHDKPGRFPIVVNAHDYCYAELGYSADVYAGDLEHAIDQYTASNHRGFYVFNHDRNEGLIGGPYALDATKRLVPYLQQHGYVFVGPVMWFSRPSGQDAFAKSSWSSQPGYYETFRTADVTGDGRASVCARGSEGVYCAKSKVIPASGPGTSPRVLFDRETLWSTDEFSDAALGRDLGYAATMMLADVNHDGKAALLMRTPKGIAVALSDGAHFQKPNIWSYGKDFSDDDTDPLNGRAGGWKTDASRYETFRIADVNGDGYPDICARTQAGVICALNNGHGGFSKYALWEGTTFSDASGGADVRYAATMMLADVDGDGKADLIVRSPSGLMVALSNGKGFDTPQLWTDGNDFSDLEMDTATNTPMFWSQPGRYQTFRAADLNGDGKVDVCAMGPSGLVCVLSNGSRFLKATNWDYRFSPEFTAKNGWTQAQYTGTLMFGDLNGDGRADFMVRGASGLLDGFAP